MQQIRQNFFPSDFVHCILSAFVADDETGYIAGGCTKKKGSQVEFVQEDALYIFMRDQKNIDMNDYIKNWSILEIFDDEQTGYLGIIFENANDTQLVLAHRSTSPKTDLSNILKKSSLQCDIVSVLIGGISTHQAQGFFSTEQAVKLAKKKNYQLSFSGHSLGAWLAEMSVYYCHVEFEYFNVKAVTIDGPGSFEMMQYLSQNEIRGGLKSFDESELDIVSYLSAPNLVNCCNTHIGTVYRLYNDLKSEGTPAFINSIINKISPNKNSLNALLATFGHFLKYILPFFDPILGKPKEEDISIVKKWPKIKHNNNSDIKKMQTQSRENMIKMGTNLLAVFRPSLLYVKQVSDQIFPNIMEKGIEKLFNFLSPRALKIFSDNEEPNTFFSIVIIINELCNGNISQDQFWNIHSLLDNGYNIKIENDEQQFKAFANGYSMGNADRKIRKISDKIDKHLKEIKVRLNRLNQINVSPEFKQKIHNICNQYEYSNGAWKEILRAKNDQDFDKIRGLFRFILKDHEEDLEKFMSDNNQMNLSRQEIRCFLNKLQNKKIEEIIERGQILKILIENIQSSNVVVIKGGPGLGKTIIVTEVAKLMKHQDGTKVWPFNAKNINSLKSDYSNYTENVLEIDTHGKSEEDIKQILQNKIDDYGLKILFIFDNVENYTEEMYYYIDSLPKNVKLIITTRNKIILKSTWKQLELNEFNQNEGLQYLEKNIKGKDLSKNQISEVLAIGNLIPLKLSQIVVLINNRKRFSYEKLLEEIKNNEKNMIYGSILPQFDEKTFYILNILCWLDPIRISFEFLQNFENDQTVLEHSLEILNQNSIISYLDDYNIKIHRVYQKEIFKTQVDPSYAEDVASKIINLIPTISSNEYTTNEKKQIDNNHGQGKHLYDLLKERKVNIKLNLEVDLSYKLANIYNYCIHQPYEAKNLYLNAVNLIDKNNIESFDSITLILDLHINFLNLVISYFKEEIDDYQKQYYFLSKLTEDVEIQNDRFSDIHFLCAQIMLKKQWYDQFQISIEKAIQSIASKKNIKMYKYKKLLGDFNHELNKNDIAMQYYIECILIAEKFCGKQKIISKCDIYNCMSITLDINQSAKKIEHLKLAMNECEQAFNTKFSENYVRYCHNLADVYYKIKNYAESIKFYKEAAEIYIKIYSGENNIKLYHVYYYIGLNLSESEDKQKSNEYFEKSLALAKRLNNQQFINHALNMMGAIEADNGNLIEYIRITEQIIQNKMKNNEYHDKLGIGYFNQLSDIYGAFCNDSEKQDEIYKQMISLTLYSYRQMINHMFQGGVQIDFSNNEEILDRIQMYEKKFGLYEWDSDKHSLIFKRLDKQGFFKNNGNSNRIFIKRIGISSERLLQIKKQLYPRTLRSMVLYASQDKGINDIIKLNYIKNQLGKQFISSDDIEIAYMLLFEALNIGISQNNFNNITLSKKFIDNIEIKIIDRLIKEHPEYFIDGQILRLFVQDQIQLEQLILQPQIVIDFQQMNIILQIKRSQKQNKIQKNYSIITNNMI